MRYALGITLFIVVLSGACYLSYSLGRSNARVEYITKEIEVVKYVERKTAEIQAMPNANRSELLDLMYSGKL